MLANNKNFTKEVVATLTEEALDAIIGNQQVSVDYGINGAQPVNNTQRKRPSVLLGETTNEQ